MSRWRPKGKPASPYITRSGMQQLREELKQLWQRRDEVVTALSAAAAEGDRSENAEYIYRKKQLRELDRRLGYLQRRLPELKVVERVATDDKVYFGAWVTLADEDDQQRRYRIVGHDEWDQAEGYISLDSPMARTLLGKRVGDEVTLDWQGRQQCFDILAIDYDD